MARVKNPRHHVRIGIVGKYVEFPDSYKSLNEALHPRRHRQRRQGRAGLRRRRGDRGAATGRARSSRSTASWCRSASAPAAPRGRSAPSATPASTRCRSSASASACSAWPSSSRATSAASRTPTPRSSTRTPSSRSSTSCATCWASRRWAAPCGSAPTPASSSEGTLARRIYGVRRDLASATATATRSTRNTCETLREHGLVVSGMSPDGKFVEMVELPDHPWFLGCQFHPEYKSKPTEPHPLFVSYIARRARGARAARPARARQRAPGDGADGRPAGLSRAGNPMAPPAAITLAPGVIIGGDALPVIAGPCVIEIPRAAPRRRPRRSGDRPPARAAAGLQVLLRQGQPELDQELPRSGPERRVAHPGRGQARDRAADAHRRARALAVRACCRGLRRAADPGLPLPPDRPGRRRGAHRPGGQRQEGPVPRSRRHAAGGRQGALRRATTGSPSPSAASPSATTTWWSTCALSPASRRTASR